MNWPADAVEWWAGDVVSLWHGTSSASLEGILSEGLVPPPGNLERYVSEICQGLVGSSLSELPIDVRRGVEEYCMGPRRPHAGLVSNGSNGSVIFLYPHPAVHRAAAYAHSFAEDGGEIAYTVRKHLEGHRGVPLLPLLAGSSPIVLRVDLPTESCLMKGGGESLADYAMRLDSVWQRSNNGSHHLGTLDEFMTEAAESEVVFPGRIQPGCIAAVHAVTARGEIDPTPLGLEEAVVAQSCP